MPYLLSSKSWKQGGFGALAACMMLWSACASGPPAQPAQQDPASRFFERGLEAGAQGRPHAALDHYTRYLEHYGDDPFFAVPALNNRGTVYWSLGRHEEAINDFDKASQLDPSSAMTFINRGNVYADMGKPDKAIADYTRAIHADEKNGLAYSNRALAWSALGRFDLAMPDLDKAIELGHPGLDKSLMKRAVLRFGTKDFEGAVQDLTQVIKLLPDYTEAYFFRSQAFQAMGEPAKAEKDMLRAMELRKAQEGQQTP